MATLKANFFVGHNLGNNFFKLGFLCLIGIAHLADSMSSLRFYKSFDLRPSLTTNLGKLVEDELFKTMPKNNAQLIAKNLFCAIKTVAAHVIDKVPICGNIEYEPEKDML